MGICSLLLLLLLIQLMLLSAPSLSVPLWHRAVSPKHSHRHNHQASSSDEWNKHKHRHKQHQGISSSSRRLILKSLVMSRRVSGHNLTVAESVPDNSEVDAKNFDRLSGQQHRTKSRKRVNKWRVRTRVNRPSAKGIKTVLAMRLFHKRRKSKRLGRNRRNRKKGRRRKHPSKVMRDKFTSSNSTASELQGMKNITTKRAWKKIAHKWTKEDIQRILDPDCPNSKDPCTHVAQCKPASPFYCQNGGICIFIRYLEIRTCWCPRGFTGKRCQRKTKPYGSFRRLRYQSRRRAPK